MKYFQGFNQILYKESYGHVEGHASSLLMADMLQALSNCNLIMKGKLRKIQQFSSKLAWFAQSKIDGHLIFEENKKELQGTCSLDT